MSKFQSRDPDYADRVTELFRNESVAFKWGGEITALSPGSVDISLVVATCRTREVEAIHRHTISALMDDACVLAALSLTSPGDRVTVFEYKLNFLASVTSNSVVAQAEVVRPGRSITVCRADALAGGQLVARMLATLAVSRAT